MSRFLFLSFEMFDSVKSDVSKQISRTQENGKKLLAVTMEAYELDPWRATLITLNAIFSSCCHYVETFLDAQLLSHCILALQKTRVIETRPLVLLITTRILAVILRYGLGESGRRLNSAFGTTVARKRALRLLKTYFELSYLEQTKRATRQLFTDVLPLLRVC